MCVDLFAAKSVCFTPAALAGARRACAVHSIGAIGHLRGRLLRRGVTVPWHGPAAGGFSTLSRAARASSRCFLGVALHFTLYGI